MSLQYNRNFEKVKLNRTKNELITLNIDIIEEISKYALIEYIHNPTFVQFIGNDKETTWSM